jgi:hypothetical protein
VFLTSSQYIRSCALPSFSRLARHLSMANEFVSRSLFPVEKLCRALNNSASCLIRGVGRLTCLLLLVCPSDY